MSRLAGPAILLLATTVLAGLANAARAQDATAADCVPLSDLIFQSAEPALRQIGPGTERVHFAKDGSAKGGCPNAEVICADRAFLLPGDAVVVTRTKDAYACAIFTSPPPKTASSSGWLPIEALADPSAAGLATESEWLGDWRYGSEQRIRITSAPDDRVTIAGEATFGAHDPDRVKRGAVNTGVFTVTVATAAGQAAFLVGNDGKPLAYDAQQAKDQVLCGLRSWRLGPYLIVADNLQCGGNGVTFTGVYRRVGKPA
jgi:hypothetical protein